MAKPPHKILLAAAVLGLLLGAWAVQVALSPPPGDPKPIEAGSALKIPPLPPRPDQAQGERLRARNFFVNALINTPTQAAAGQPQLAPNEVRDSETAEIFRFIGTVRTARGFSALFVKRLETPGPLQIQAVPSRAGLSPRILIGVVSERKAALLVDGRSVEVEIFAPRPAAPQGQPGGRPAAGPPVAGHDVRPPAAAIHSK